MSLEPLLVAKHVAIEDVDLAHDVFKIARIGKDVTTKQIYFDEPWMNEILPGGWPTGTSTVITGSGGTGKPLVGQVVAGSWLRQGGGVVFMSLQYPSHEFIVEGLRRIPRIELEDYAGKVAFIELDAEMDGLTVESPGRIGSRKSADRVRRHQRHPRRLPGSAARPGRSRHRPLWFQRGLHADRRGHGRSVPAAGVHAATSRHGRLMASTTAVPVMRPARFDPSIAPLSGDQADGACSIGRLIVTAWSLRIVSM